MEESTVPLQLLTVIRESGFNPIAYTVMYGFDTFLFKTNLEAVKAYEKLDDTISAWWYGLDDYYRDAEIYKTEVGSKPAVTWI